MKYYCIYRIVNKVNGKSYIGQHCYKDEHDPLKGYFGSGKLIRRAVKKYGKENFTKEVLYGRILNKSTVDIMEIWAIEKYQPDYNIAKGGTGGDLGEDVRKRMSESAKKKFESYRRLGVPLKPKNFVYHPARALHKYWDSWIAYWTQYLSYSARTNSGNRYTEISKKLTGRKLSIEDRAKKSAAAKRASIKYHKYKFNGGVLTWNEWRKVN